jgi:acylphosphatase
MLRAHLVVYGRVQGVGFRAFVIREARALGLTGRVRNRGDGAVEIDAEGERGSLEQLVAAVRRGPIAARIERVEESMSEGPARHRDFHIA